MADRHDITLREAEGEGPPDWLEEVKRAVGELFAESETAAKKFVRGKGEQEVAKAMEIKARVFTALGNLDLERHRLIEDRDRAIRSDEKELAMAAMEHRAKMYELKTQRLKELVEAAKALKELGVRINLTEIGKELIRALKDDESDNPEPPAGILADKSPR